MRCLHEIYFESHLPLYDSSVAFGGNVVHASAATGAILVSGYVPSRGRPFSMIDGRAIDANSPKQNNWSRIAKKKMRAAGP